MNVEGQQKARESNVVGAVLYDCSVLDVGPVCFSMLTKCSSRARLHLMSNASCQESTHWSISICFCASPRPSSLPQVEKNGECITQCERVKEREEGKGSEQLCVRARVCVRAKHTRRVSEGVISFTTTSFQRSDHHRRRSC